MSGKSLPERVAALEASTAETEDPVARAMIREHIDECRIDRTELIREIAALKADVWAAIDRLRGWWFKLGAGLVSLLAVVVLALASYIWSSGGPP